MSAVRLALMGIGSVRCGAPIVASLATYFGERPLEIRMYDSDAERLDLFDRLARVCFVMTQATHHIISTESPEEALDDANSIVLSVSQNCANKLLASRGIDPMDQGPAEAIELLNLAALPNVSVLSLQREPIKLESYYQLSWPDEPSPQERANLPFQILRWLNEEEYPHQLLQQNEKSPLKQWLENPTTAEYVRTS